MCSFISAKSAEFETSWKSNSESKISHSASENLKSTLSKRRNRFPGRNADGEFGALTLIFVAAIAAILVVAAVLAVTLYKKFWYKSLHFDNPIYVNEDGGQKPKSNSSSSISMTTTTTGTSSAALLCSASRNATSTTLVSEDADSLAASEVAIPTL